MKVVIELPTQDGEIDRLKLSTLEGHVVEVQDASTGQHLFAVKAEQLYEAAAALYQP